MTLISKPLISLPRANHGAATIALIASILAFSLVKSHVHRIYGGYVKRVDPEQFHTERESIAITDVNVLSADGNSMLPGQTVVIEDGEIASVGTQNSVPQSARVIDGQGKYLIPGLIDSHVHIRRQPNDLLLYVANGVTHIRDLSGSKSDLELREQAENGRIAPRIYVTSPLLFSSGRVRGWVNSFIGPRKNVGNAARADSVVRDLAEDGYDALKTYANIDLETYRAVNKAAAEIGMHTVGHLPFEATLDELAVTGQQELAHVEEMVKVLRDEYRGNGGKNYDGGFAGYVASRSDAIIDDLLANDITVNTTLWLSEIIGEQAFELRRWLQSLPLEYANPAMVEGSPYTKEVGWLPGRNAFEASLESSAEERERIERSWEAYAEGNRVLFRRMVERGVRIIAGTDATTHLMIPGFSLHGEMESLVRNGMTPAQALRATTETPARLIGSDAGIIQSGRRADLLLLEANPLEDIRNTRAIDSVVLGGRWLGRDRLNQILGAVEQANAASRKFNLQTLEL